MKISNKFLAIVLAFVCSSAFAGAYDIFVQQRNSTDTGNLTRQINCSGGPSSCLMYYDFNTQLPTFVTLGTNLSVTSGVLNAASGASQVSSDWNAVSGVAQILNKPSLATVALTGDAGDLLAGTLATGARNSISLTTTGSSGVATYNSTTGVFNIPSYGGGTVTSITAGTGLSGGTITTTGTISLPNVGTAGTYDASVTTDSQGRVSSGTTTSINDNPGRSLVTTTSSTGFQISSTRKSHVCYEGFFSTTSTIGGPASGSVFLETADTNSTTPSDWTTKAHQTYSNTITLAVVLNQVQANNWSFCRYIPAGKFVRIRSSFTGTASVSINSDQQEVQL